MTTYANIKLNEIFALYGNPFTRGSCKKNFFEKIMEKQFKKINFQEEKKNEIKKEINLEESSQLNLINKNENNLLHLKQNYPKIKFGELSNYKNNSKLNFNTDAFSMNSQKRKQRELIKRTFGNFSSEGYGDNTKMSSAFQNIKKFGNAYSEKI